MAAQAQQRRSLVPALRWLGRLPLRPVTLLVLQLVLVYGARYQIHGFSPAYMPDSSSYIQAAQETTVAGVLSHYRTYGYPLFLRMIGGVGEGAQRIPEVQFALYSLGILLFWLGLLRYTNSPWLAFAGATPLPYAFVVDLVPEIMTDSLAAALTLAVVGLLLALAARPAAPLLWVAVAVAVFAAYQVRPTLVFLIAWVPVMAVVLRLCREGRVAPRLNRWLIGLVLATALPYLLFAGTRRLIVGHFGLVSFGGTNLAGVAACFLDPQVVKELPEEHRRVARTMLTLRRRAGWRPMTPDGDAEECFAQYSENIWTVAMRAVGVRIRQEQQRLEEQGKVAEDLRPTRIRRNEMLTGVAHAIIRERPWLYLKWVRSSIVYGLGRLGERPWVVWPCVLLACSTPLLALRRQTAGGAPGVRHRDRLLLALFVLGVSYFLIYLFLIALVSWPFPRYFSATILFLPSVLCMPLFEVWRRLLDLRPGPQSA